MKRTVYYIFRFLDLSLKTTEFFIRMLLFENFKNYLRTSRNLREKNRRELFLLGNGPSLASSLKEILSSDSFYERDYLAVNYLANSNEFEVIKPKYYVLSDPQFFRNSHVFHDRSIQLLKSIIEKTKWEMNLYIPYCYRKEFENSRVSENIFITVIPFHSIPFEGFEFLRFFVYKKGLGNGEFGSVIQNGIYLAIELGYSELHLFGVDHNYFDGLTVNEANELMVDYSHYVNAPNSSFQRVSISDDRPVSIDHYLKWNSDIFAGHRILNKYSTYRNSSIINRTKNSYIDAYIRNCQ